MLKVVMLLMASQLLMATNCTFTNLNTEIERKEVERLQNISPSITNGQRYNNNNLTIKLIESDNFSIYKEVDEIKLVQRNDPGIISNKAEAAKYLEKIAKIVTEASKKNVSTTCENLIFDKDVGKEISNGTCEICLNGKPTFGDDGKQNGCYEIHGYEPSTTQFEYHGSLDDNLGWNNMGNRVTYNWNNPTFTVDQNELNLVNEDFSDWRNLNLQDLTDQYYVSVDVNHGERIRQRSQCSGVREIFENNTLEEIKDDSNRLRDEMKLGNQLCLDSTIYIIKIRLARKCASNELVVFDQFYQNGSLARGLPEYFRNEKVASCNSEQRLSKVSPAYLIN